MKIGFDAKRLFNNFTGLGNYSRTLVKNFQSRYPEHEIHLFSPTTNRNKETEYFFDGSRFAIHTCNHSFKNYWRQYQVTKLVQQLRLDVYHGLSHELPLGIQKLSCKTFLSFHDLIYEYYPKQFPILDRFFYRMKYKSSAVRAGHILAISESTKRDLQKLYDIPQDRISVLYQSCQDIFFEDRVMSNPLQIDRYFLYVGSIIERKGLLQIVEAQALISKEDRIPIVIIGKGKAYEEIVRSRIVELNLNDDFIFMDYVSNHELPSYYRFAKALIYPSVYEGFGIPVIESLLSQTPVITSKISSLPEAAGPGALFIDPRKTEEIADAMIKIVQEEDFAQRLAKQGRDYAQSKFNADTLSEELLKHYQRIS